MMLETMAELAAWHEDWRIKTTESSIEIYGPRWDSGTLCQWAKLSPPERTRLRNESLTSEFSRDAIRKRKEAEGIPAGPFPEEVGRDER
jgi:hypothetical protein